MATEKWKILREANDPMAVRLSIGVPHEGTTSDGFDGYIVYRGESEKCIDVLERALAQLKEHYEGQGG
jgi:hypothetical protein